MEQLLQITTVPIKYELSVTHARYERKSQTSEVIMDHQPARLQMRSSNAKLFINTRAARSSVCPTTIESVEKYASDGMQAAKDATARYAKEGQRMANALPEDNVLHQIFAERVSAPTGQFMLGFIPTVGPEIQYQEADLQTQYQADKLSFDVRVSHGDIEYIPGDVSVNITQWPDVIIEYIGSPVYVPPSASERFEASA